MNKKVLFFLLILISVFLVSCSSKIKTVTFDEEANTFSCKYENLTRSFILCLPETIQRNETPLILMLHGYGGSAQTFMKDTFFNEDANKRGYAVAYINGIPRQNDSTSQRGWNYNNDKYGKTDMDFLCDISRYIQKEYGLSKKNLFAIGFSNGGFMCNKLAINKNNFFTGVVSAAGMMPIKVWETRSSKSKIAFLQINGTKDDVVPMRLNNSHKYNHNPAMEDVIQYFVKSNKVENRLVETELSQNTKAYNYGNKVCWVITEGGHHNWLDSRFTDYDANQVILDFLDLQLK